MPGYLSTTSQIYPYDVSHIICWLADIAFSDWGEGTHALVLGGHGCRQIYVFSNLQRGPLALGFLLKVSPAHTLGRFNGYVKSVILRVSEARDLGDAKLLCVLRS